MNAWIVYIDLDQIYQKQSQLQFMAVILLTGAVALILLGGGLVFVGLAKGNVIQLLIGIGMVAGGVAVAIWKADEGFSDDPLKRKHSFSTRTEAWKDYERDYLARQGIESTSRKPTARRKPAETRESENNFCDNCGKSLRPTAKFCGSCGTSVP